MLSILDLADQWMSIEEFVDLRRHLQRTSEKHHEALEHIPNSHTPDTMKKYRDRLIALVREVHLPPPVVDVKVSRH